MSDDLPIPPSAVIASPANFLALGGGLGLAPQAPGTFGTLIGIPLLFLMPDSLPYYLLVTLVLAIVGVWCCHVCARDLGVHDHPGIVWDEVIGYLITMVAMPRSVVWVLVGFMLFRIFDILKPWPIRWIDQRVEGGLGIMLDDVLAGVFAAICLQIIYRLV